MTEEEIEKETPANEAPQQEKSEQVEQIEQVELMKVLMNGESFLIPVDEVVEIIRPIKLTPVPMAPDHMLGLANIRGQIVCIVDPGKVLHLKQQHGERNEDTRYLILRHPRMHLGIWVDEVSDLFRVAKNDLPVFDNDKDAHLHREIELNDQLFKLLNVQGFFE